MVIVYKRLFASEDGQKVLHDLVRSTPILKLSYTSDSHETAFNEGARSVVLRILRTINITETEMEDLGRKVEEQYEL